MSYTPGQLTPAEMLEYDRRHVFHPWIRQQDASALCVTGGAGSYFFDAAGNRYLDFSSLWMYQNLGHQHPRILAAIAAQSASINGVCPDFVNEPAALLGKRLAELTPGDLRKALFTTGGTEANETAVKIARAYTGRWKIITRYRSYHGNTLGAGSLSGDPRRLPLEPGVPGVVRALDHYCYRCPFGQGPYPDCNTRCIDHIAELIELEGPGQVAAVLAEPVVASNGVLVPPPNYWPRLRQICDAYGVLLIADEVVTGFGRTGTWFGCNHWDVAPDIMVMAKGLTAGHMPLGAVIVSDRIATYFDDHYFNAGLTYGSHPTSCAAALATLETIEEEGVVEQAARSGERLLAGLRALRERHPSVGEVRGMGMYYCLELVTDRVAKTRLVPFNATPEQSRPAGEVARRLWERRVKVSLRWNLLSVAPPLNIAESEMDEGLAAIDHALEAADQAYVG